MSDQYSLTRPEARLASGRSKFARLLSTFVLGFVVAVPIARAAQDRRLIDVIADSDNKFKVPGQKRPVITLRAGERIRLRVTSRKGPEWRADGMVHSLTIVELRDQGWDLLLREGTQEFELTAPTEPGEYKVECTVKCGLGHNEMQMKLVVLPAL